MLREILRQLGIAEHGSQYEMIQAFRRHLRNLRLSDRILILIDEAHHLGDATLGQIAELAEADAPGVHNLGFGLAAQPELSDRITSSRHQSLDRLIVARAKLTPLSAEESLRYVAYRLATYDGATESVFARDALEYLLDRASGSPLRINVLCHNAMLLAHAARARLVEVDFARKAVQEFAGRSPGTGSARPKRDPIHSFREPVDTAARTRATAPSATMVAISKTGMGIGLVIACLVMISVIWLVEMRSQDSHWNNDGEVPSIFNDALSASDGGADLGATRASNSDASVAAPKSGLVRPLAAGKMIARNIQHGTHSHRQVIGESGTAESSTRASSGVSPLEAAN
jgi:hypothetical protein